MKTGTLGHIKLRRLKRLLNKALYQTAGILTCIWHLAAECADEGDIGRFTDDEISDYLEWDGDPKTLTDALVNAGWLDRDNERRLVVHDWLDHCPGYISERLKKRRLRRRKHRTCDAKTGDKEGTSEGQQGDNQGTVPGMSPTCPLFTQSSQVQSVDSSDVCATSEPAILTYPTNGKVKSWELTQSQVDEWAGLYPGIDVMAECRKALAWSKANPAKRKTAGGMPRFLVSWLGKANDRGGATNGKSPTAADSGEYTPY